MFETSQINLNNELIKTKSIQVMSDCQTLTSMFKKMVFKKKKINKNA